MAFVRIFRSMSSSPDTQTTARPDSSVTTPKVIVIGAGLGGLSAAIRLAAAGYRVHVFESQSGPGGKAFSERLGRYRFDTGPSLFTMRSAFEDLFAVAGRRLDDYLALQPLEEVCRYFWRDGTRMTSRRGAAALGQEMERALGEPATNVERYLSYSSRIWNTAADLFLRHSLHDRSTLASAAFWRAVPGLPRIDALRSMDAAHAAFFTQPKTRQFFNRYATYNGSDPHRAPATLNLIPHLEYQEGAHAVVDGIYAVPRALERVARELGVAFSYGVRVERILFDNRRRIEGVVVRSDESSASDAAGAATPRGAASAVQGAIRGVPGGGSAAPDATGIAADSATTVDAQIVVSDVDVTPTYRDLLRDEDAPLFKRYRRLEPSSSGVVFYWGIRRAFGELSLHNIFFSDDYGREFDELFEQRRCPSDPTIYLNITSKTTGGEAPDGCENWFVLVNAPYDAGQDWDAEAQRVRDAVLRRLSTELRVDIESLIEAESRLLPPDIERRTAGHRGSLYGISSNSRGAAFLRHPNRSRRYPGLYFVGGSAHPGGGMPLVVLGGGIVANLVQRYQPL